MLTPADIGLSPTRFPSFRPGQAELAMDIALSEKLAFGLSAPPGTGKSPLYISAALMSDCRTLILVPNKALQTQLTRDFAHAGLFSIVGHSNYPCYDGVFFNDVDDSTTAQDPTCTAPDGECEYKDIDVPRAQSSNLVVTNYQHWIAIQKSDDPGKLGNFDMLVLDEAHEAADILCSMLAVTIRPSLIQSIYPCQLPSPDAPFTSWVTWAKELLPIIRQLHRTRRESNPYDKRSLSKLNNLATSLRQLAIINTSTEQWVVERTMDRGQAKITITPVWAARYARQYLFAGIPKIVLSSGTLSKIDCEYLSLNPETELEFRDIDSVFAASRRPFYYIPTTRVEFKMQDGDRRYLVNRIDQVIDTRSEVKGIIPCRSYNYQESIVSLSKHRNSGIFITHGRGQVNAAVDQFRRSAPPSALVSPAIEEGFDFIGDLARYGILVKVPFIDRRTPINAARCRDDKRYPTVIASKKIVQSAMRIVRDAADWGEFFCFDDHFAHFRRNGDFPKWFRSAFRQLDRVPAPLKF